MPGEQAVSLIPRRDRNDYVELETTGLWNVNHDRGTDL